LVFQQLPQLLLINLRLGTGETELRTWYGVCAV